MERKGRNIIPCGKIKVAKEDSGKKIISHHQISGCMSSEHRRMISAVSLVLFKIPDLVH